MMCYLITASCLYLAQILNGKMNVLLSIPVRSSSLPSIVLILTPLTVLRPMVMPPFMLHPFTATLMCCLFDLELVTMYRLGLRCQSLFPLTVNLLLIYCLGALHVVTYWGSEFLRTSFFTVFERSIAARTECLARTRAAKADLASRKKDKRWDIELYPRTINRTKKHPVN